MNKQYSIQKIIIGCCKNEPKCQRLLVDRFADRLYAISLRYMKEKELAKDMLQESLLKIFKNIKTFDSSKASLYTWMSTITVRTCLRKLEKKSLEIIHLEEGDREFGFSPEILDKLKVQDLIDLVNLLPSGYSEVFNLNVIDGFSHKEISAMLGITDVASRSRLKRAKTLLKKYIHNIQTERSWKNII